MLATGTGWTFDPTRNKYYYYDAAQRAYVYSDGDIIRLPPEAQATTTASSKYVIFILRILVFTQTVRAAPTPAPELSALQY
jgi:hypothetical protein